MQGKSEESYHLARPWLSLPFDRDDETVDHSRPLSIGEVHRRGHQHRWSVKIGPWYDL